MFRLYKLETEKRNKLNLETIYDYLDLYNGHTGYTLLAEVKTKQEFNSTIGEFTTNWNPYRKEKNIIALVIEDMDENIIDILYETEEKTLKWAEKNCLNSDFFENAFSKNRKGMIYKNDNGYHFYSKRGITYYLLEGKTIGSSKGKTSDIVFIMLGSVNYNTEDLFVGYFFGAYNFVDNPYLFENQIAEIVEEYEKENFDKQ